MKVFRKRLVAKLGLLLLLTVSLGFAVFTFVQARGQLSAVERMHRQSATALVQGLIAGVRNAMLAGEGMTARRMLEDLRGRVGTAAVVVYSPAGARVFEAKAPAPDPATLPDHVRGAMETGKGGAAAGPDGADVRVIPNQPRCRTCHEQGDTRGILTLAVKEGDEAAPARRPRELADVAHEAFVQIMVSDHHEQLDAYFAELARDVGPISAVSVLNPSGSVSFGDRTLAPRELHRRVVKGEEAVSEADGDSVVHVLPLPNSARCQVCHLPHPKVRGTLVVRVGQGAIDQAAFTEAVTTSLQHIMLSGLGRIVTGFLDRVASLESVVQLTLHDAEGRLFHGPMDAPTPPSWVARALKDGVTIERRSLGAGNETFTYVEPLRNEPACQQCHGSDRPLRGAVAVTLDTSEAASERRELLTQSTALTVVTLVLVLLVLYVGLRITVITPVRNLGRMAERVGKGDLSAESQLTSIDEIGRLGGHFNHMVGGLRKKLELGKFVSDATMNRVDAHDGALSRGGERSRLAILFSDVRGFTAYAEQHEPEAVVAVLNRYLQVQADVVERNHGDIDKFLGDGLMARFTGPDMVADAIRCGVELAIAVKELHAAEDTDTLGLGVGVNVGEVVLGAMGAEQRMDYTVIGDAVNLASRLCSAAPSGGVYVSAAARDDVGGALPGIVLEALDPITVKGKRDALAVYSARPADA